jgi:hypothetical protein
VGLVREADRRHQLDHRPTTHRGRHVDDDEAIEPAREGGGPHRALGADEHGRAAGAGQLGPEPVVELGGVGEHHDPGQVAAVVAEHAGQRMAPLDRAVDEALSEQHLCAAQQALVEQPADRGLPHHGRIERHGHLCTFTELWRST